MYHSRMQIIPKIDKWSQLRAENNPLHATTFLDSLLPRRLVAILAIALGKWNASQKDQARRLASPEGVKALSTRHPGSR